MKTITRKLTDLETAVIEQLGCGELDEDCICTLEDITNHGIYGGFSGFIYHQDTVSFFDNNRTLILSALTELANDLGESASDMVKGFRCLQVQGDSWNHEIDAVLMNLPCEEDTQVKNALAWFAAEHVAYNLVNELEEAA